MHKTTFFARARLWQTILFCAGLILSGPGPAPAQAQATGAHRAGTQPSVAALTAGAPVAPSRVAIPASEVWLHGLSSIHTTDGQRFLALSNRGFLIHGRFQRDRAGRLTGFAPEGVHTLTFPDGRPLTNGFRAAEGLAVAPDGRLFVAFEYHNRVWTWARPGARPQDTGAHRDFARLRNGRGFEALAIGPDGSVYAIPERPARMTHGFPAYRWSNGEWVGSFRMPSDGNFLPVSADFGPDRHLYVLEYDPGSGQGARSQIRRFPVQGDAMGRGVVVMRSAPGQFGRLSGLSVWGGPRGPLRATMISDNGGISDRASELIETVLPG